MSTNQKTADLQTHFSLIDDLMRTSLSLKDVFNATFKWNDEIAFEYVNDHDNEVKVTYSAYRDHCYATAYLVNEKLHGIPANTAVGLKAENSHKWAPVFWALLMRGYCPVLLNTREGHDATAETLERAGCSAVITDDGYSYNLPTYTVDGIYSESAKNASFFRHVPQNWEDKVFFCSSGTTGTPKILGFSGKNICHQISAARDLPRHTQDIMYPHSMGELKNLALLPFYHVFGFVAVFLWYTFFGRTLVFLSSPHPRQILAICKRLKVTHVFSVPLLWNEVARSIVHSMEQQREDKLVMFNKMVAYNCNEITKKEAGNGASAFTNRYLQNQLFGTQIRYCISGGGFISKDVLRTINGLGFPLYNGYGMTELGVTSVELSPDVKQRLHGSIGKPLHGIEYKIDDPDRRGIGELLVKTPQRYSFELEKGEIKAASFADEWFRTGDVVTCDSIGYHINGRIKDVIINENGENVFPDEIESYFRFLPYTKQICALATDGVNGNKVLTLVVETNGELSPKQRQEIEKKIRTINLSLPAFKRVLKIYITTAPIPVTSTSKVRRSLVKENLESSAYTKASGLKPPQQLNVDELTEKWVRKLQQIVGTTLMIEPEKVYPSAHLIADLGCDSLLYTDIICKIEDEFEIQFAPHEFSTCNTIEEFVVFINEKISPKA